jgi:hypothetical protein
MLLLQFENKLFFCALVSFFPMSSAKPTEKYIFFLCVIFFLCGCPHRKIIFNLGKHNFSVCKTYRKTISDGEPTENSIFLSFYFCGLFSDGTPSEKYFSVGIHIFLWVFAHIEVFKILEL